MEAERWILMYNENKSIFDYTYADNVTRIMDMFLELNKPLQDSLKSKYNLTDEYIDARLKERMLYEV